MFQLLGGLTHLYACFYSSSDNDYADISSSGSEEIIWQPLKIVDAAIPLHPVCTSRVQVIITHAKAVVTMIMRISPPVEEKKLYGSH